jgi:hypothetical protein
MTMTSIPVALEVTVHTDSYLATYGSDPTTDLPEHLAHNAAYAPRLLALAAPAETADVRLTTAHILTPHTPGHTRLLVTLDATVNTEAWRSRYGSDPQRAVGAHIAAELATASPMRDEINGSVIYLPPHP